MCSREHARWLLTVGLDGLVTGINGFKQPSLVQLLLVSGHPERSPVARKLGRQGARDPHAMWTLDPIEGGMQADHGPHPAGCNQQPELSASSPRNARQRAK